MTDLERLALRRLSESIRYFADARVRRFVRESIDSRQHESVADALLMLAEQVEDVARPRG